MPRRRLRPALGGFVSLIVCSANLPDKIAIAVDTQMDDGVPNTGTVRGQLHTAGPNPDITSDRRLGLRRDRHQRLHALPLGVTR